MFLASIAIVITINLFVSAPNDLLMYHKNAEAIYKLYCAMIVQGSDSAHSSNPISTVKRSEVSAILMRMMCEDVRFEFCVYLEAEKDSGETVLTKEDILEDRNEPNDNDQCVDDDRKPVKEEDKKPEKEDKKPAGSEFWK